MSHQIQNINKDIKIILKKTMVMYYLMMESHSKKYIVR